MLAPHLVLRALAITVSLLGLATMASAQAGPPAEQVSPQQAPAPAAQPSAPVAYPAEAPQGAVPAESAPPQQGYTPQQAPLGGQQPAYSTTPPGYYGQPGYVQPGYGQPGYGHVGYDPQRWQPPRRTRRGLMFAGIAVLSAAYLLSVSVGAATLDNNDYNENEYDEYGSSDLWGRDAARWLFVPVLGPFIGMSQTDDGDGPLVLLGMAQMVGIGLTVGGVILYKNTREAAAREGFTQWKLPKGRALSVDMATSARFTGPRLRMSF